MGLLALAWLVHELVTSYDQVANVFVEPLWIGEEATLDWFTAWAWVTLLVVVGAGGGRAGRRPCRRKETGQHPDHPAVARNPGAPDCGRRRRVSSRLGPGGRDADRPRPGGGPAPGAGALPGATAAELPEAAPEPGLPAARRRGGAADHPQQPRVGSRADPGWCCSGGSGVRRTKPVPQVAALGRAQDARPLAGGAGLHPLRSGRAGDVHRDAVLPRPDPGCGVRPGRVHRGGRRARRTDELAGDTRACASSRSWSSRSDFRCCRHADTCRRSFSQQLLPSALPWPWSSCGGAWATA